MQNGLKRSSFARSVKALRLQPPELVDDAVPVSQHSTRLERIWRSHAAQAKDPRCHEQVSLQHCERVTRCGSGRRRLDLMSTSKCSPPNCTQRKPKTHRSTGSLADGTTSSNQVSARQCNIPHESSAVQRVGHAVDCPRPRMAALSFGALQSWRSEECEPSACSRVCTMKMLQPALESLPCALREVASPFGLRRRAISLRSCCKMSYPQRQVRLSPEPRR